MNNTKHLIHRLGLRFKSMRHVDDFPFRHLKPQDVSQLSAEMESTGRLPLRSFFAQHRPLMPFAKPESKIEESKAKWVHVPVVSPRNLLGEYMPVSCMMPEDIYRRLGPFDVNKVLNSKPNSIPAKPEKSFDLPPMPPAEIQAMLGKQLPLILKKLKDGEQEFVIPLSVDATSVQRKRKLKMNRHKYRKRLKEQRTKRRRMGK